MAHATENLKSTPVKLAISEFGPISEGSIQLKPLTIFIGQNNSGKSYLAMLVRCLFEAYSRSIRWHPGFMSLGQRPELYQHFFDLANDPYKDLLESLPTNISEKEVTLSSEIVADLQKRFWQTYFEGQFSTEISRLFASPLPDLVRIGKNSFSVRLDVGEVHASAVSVGAEVQLRELNLPHKTVSIIRDAKGGFGFSVGPDKIQISVDGRHKANVSRLLLEMLLNSLNLEINQVIGRPCYYLPAARSGMLQAHKALIAGVLKKAPFFGIEPLEVPTLSGTVTDFLSSILVLPQQQGPLFPIAEKFENELIKGKIRARSTHGNPYPEIKYEFLGTEIPIHRSSSTVSELAPLFLYLKHLVQKNSVLIIEEPEAHLHPENQRILAKYLVRLVRAGVQLVVTTHSEYLLEQLNTFSLLSKLDTNKRVNEFGYSPDDYLTHDETAVYRFWFDSKRQSNVISSVESDDQDMICEADFVKIHEDLYNESIRVKNAL